jgi:hypothetical protein
MCVMISDRLLTGGSFQNGLAGMRRVCKRRTLRLEIDCAVPLVSLLADMRESWTSRHRSWLGSAGAAQLITIRRADIPH